MIVLADSKGVTYGEIEVISSQSCNETGYSEDGECTQVVGRWQGVQYEFVFDVPHPEPISAEATPFLMEARPGKAPTGKGKMKYLDPEWLKIFEAAKENPRLLEIFGAIVRGDYGGAIELLKGMG